MAKVKSPIPPGAYVGVNLDNIDEGKFRKQFERQVRRAIRELKEYEQNTDDRSGKAVVSAQLVLARAKDSKEHFTITHAVKIATPAAKSVTFVKEKDGKLLCQPIGTTEYDPDQMVIFDAQGRAIGGTDPESGEVFEPGAVKDVAGKIGQAANG